MAQTAQARSLGTGRRQTGRVCYLHLRFSSTIAITADRLPVFVQCRRALCWTVDYHLDILDLDYLDGNGSYPQEPKRLTVPLCVFSSQISLNSCRGDNTAT